MSKLDFHFEFYRQTPVPDELVAEVENRLLELADGHTDLVGAAVTVAEETSDNTPHRYRARIVAYVRPAEVVGVEDQDTPERALRGALDAVERQIRERRDRLGKPWEQPEEVVRVGSVFELTSREIFDTYADQLNPAALSTMDRTILAAELMTNKGLDQDAAFYAADEILAYAQEQGIGS